MDEKKGRRRFVDTNVFIYAMQGHPEFGEVSKKILERIDGGEKAVTSLMNIAEVCWWLEKHKMAEKIEEKVKLISSIFCLEIAPLELSDFMEASRLVKRYRIDFNDCLSIALMKRMNINTIYSNDRDFDKAQIKRIFE